MWLRLITNELAGSMPSRFLTNIAPKCLMSALSQIWVVQSASADMQGALHLITNNHK